MNHCTTSALWHECISEFLPRPPQFPVISWSTSVATPSPSADVLVMSITN